MAMTPQDMRRRLNMLMAMSYASFASTKSATASVPTGHRYWRLNITANNGNALISIAEIEMYTSAYGPNVISGGTASASTELNASWVAANAFDGALTSTPSWASSGGAPQWIKYDFGAGNPKEIKAVGIHSRGSADAAQMPKDFDVQYSDDNSTWTTAWSVTSQTGWGDYEHRLFIKPGSEVTYTGSPWGAHSYWRLISLYSNANEICFAEVEYLATPGGTDQATGGTASGTNVVGGFPASNAFDNNAGTITAFTNGLPAILQYAFPSPVFVAATTVQVRNDSTLYMPQNLLWQFADSSSGPWTTTFQRRSETGWTAGEKRSYTDPLYI